MFTGSKNVGIAAKISYEAYCDYDPSYSYNDALKQISSIEALNKHSEKNRNNLSRNSSTEEISF